MKFINIKNISFESSDLNALIEGDIQDGALSYPSSFLINQSKLNSLLSDLLQSGIDVYEKMTTKTINTLSTFYSIDLEATPNYIELNDIQIQQETLQIRA